MNLNYDVIVVGGGHAGAEAAAAAANMGSKVLLVTMNMQTIGQMSCNPAMGGIAKGQIVREIDALGGYSGIVSDVSMIQFRMLNKSKGPAMWSPRAQNDRMLFAATWRKMLENTPNVDFWQDMVKEILLEKSRVVGVLTNLGIKIGAKAVILTNGTFLNGLIHIGEKNFGGGRMGEAKATGITEQLVALGFESGRMKTGTPPRVDGRSLDYTKMEIQEGDGEIVGFSYKNIPKPSKQHPCYITYTNENVHEMLKTGFEKSPMFSGRIQGLGPRYCPSIEDKIERFAERDRHQLFVEPEGWDTVEIYVNGFSTSLPEDVQFKSLRMVPGFENVKFFRPGYAIEYDFFQPEQLKHNLETKLIENLYFAGQINGTTGYEEAACQGIMAGINAHLKLQEKEPFVLNRSEAYIGVLIDDLINKGTKEPYRMFTSRAEHRILLRQDNADLRLTEKAYNIGLADEERWRKLQQKIKEIERVGEIIQSTSIAPEEANKILAEKDSTLISQKVKLHTLLTRPNIGIQDFQEISAIEYMYKTYWKESVEQAEIMLKYAGYIQKEQEMVRKMEALENIKLNTNFDYSKITSLSAEGREKLNKIQPETIGQAGRISGVSPSDISILLVYMGRV
ncbi:MAG: tRNA uridine-5-carboxymethylaminomethyl(34) synthesis enzyme MnmG [Chitinophagales bacterium]|nr:tRNA uridine-5-carboxymethylaminomethyl(34) synthesis enzyme MnmG [Bacteroidota bacterium]MCB9043897.1 tRNA uridine-5-carboxymethylaminomethyl(34) synthesis enzyme MnmG [Chitinophagales bacterium]